MKCLCKKQLQGGSILTAEMLGSILAAEMLAKQFQGGSVLIAEMLVQAKGLSHISWAEVTSTPCNSELEESHINWAKVTSKYQNPNGTPAFKECCYISKNEENIAHTEVFTYV